MDDIMITIDSDEDEIKINQTAMEFGSCCRICLLSHCKLFPLNSYGLSEVYEQLTGVTLNHDDGLPQELCVQCVTQLNNYRNFRDKSVEGDRILKDIVKQDGMISFCKTQFNYEKVIKKKYANFSYCMAISHLDIKPMIQNASELVDTTPMQQNTTALLDIKLEQNTTELVDIKQEQNATEIVDIKLEENTTELLDIKQEQDTTALVDIKLEENTTKLLNIKQERDTTELVDIKVEENTSILIDIELVHNTSELVDIENENETGIKPDAGMEIDDAFPEAVENNNERTKEEPKMKKDETINNTEPVNNNTNEKPKRSRIRKTTRIAAEKQDVKINENFTIKELNFEEQVKVLTARKDKISKMTHKCELCCKGFINEMTLKTHLVLHSPAKGKSECEVCHVRYKYEKDARSHVRNIHRYQYSCKHCDFVVSDKSTALKHADWHKGKRYSCEVCGQVFQKKSSYFSHVRISHPSNTVCSYCGYSFINERGLHQHLKMIHFNDIKVPLSGPWCTDCNVQFSSVEVLQVHIDIKHQNAEKPVQDTKELERDKTSGTKPYRNSKPGSKKPAWLMAAPTPCEACGLVMNSWSEYKSHFVSNHPDVERKLYSTQAVKTTSNDPGLMCHKCGKTWATQTALRTHIEVHSEEKVYKCKQCEKSFKSESNLRNHRQTHLGPRYLCPICGKGFNQSGNRKRHYKYAHSEEKMFKCDYCEKRFKTKCEEKLHVKHIHLKEPWPKRNRNRTK